MLSSLVFYGFLFLALVLLPAGLILAALLVLEYRCQLWQRLVPIGDIIGRKWRHRSFARDLGTRFPRTAQFATRRMDTRNP